MSEPFGEEDIEAQVLQNWLSHFGLKYHQLHASGHISRPELTEAIRAIKPARLFPVHTENPWMFNDIHGNVVQPVVGEAYTL
jgi:mRNA degradation ribonuclease J1/J2